MTPGWTESLVPPPPAVEHSVALSKPLLLRPLWIGLSFALSDMLFALVAYVYVTDEFVHPLGMLLASLFGIAGIVYYFMSIHRLIRVMRSQPGWSCRYTPGSVIVQQFVPLLGIAGLYRWTGDVERYTNHRLSHSGKSGLCCFLGLLAGFVLVNFLPVFWVGHVLFAGSLGFIYIPIRRVLKAGPPEASLSLR